MHSPFALGAPSLLEGKVFHDNVHKALEEVSGVRGGRLTDPTDKPVHLVATAPLLENQGRNTVDSFGAVIRDRITELASPGVPGLWTEEEALLEEVERRVDDFASDGLSASPSRPGPALPSRPSSRHSARPLRRPAKHPIWASTRASREAGGRSMAAC